MALRTCVIGVVGFLVGLTSPLRGAIDLVRFDSRNVLEQIQAQAARVDLSQSGQTTALRMSAVGSGVARITIPAAGGAWDLSDREAIVLSIRNVSPRRLLVQARAENPTAEYRQDACQSLIGLDADERGELRVRLVRRPEDPGYDYFKPFFMYTRGIAVREGTVDPAQIARLVISFESASGDDVIEIHSIRADGQGVPAPVPFFPFVDQFGQYKHADWPGKIYGPEQFEYWKKLEAAELERAANPGDWNEFGGYQAGPQLPASGFFYPTKYQGKWWLVDPKGRLFWSYGPTGVGFEAASPITDREHWFEWLPQPGGEFDFCFGRGSNARFMYYRDKQYVTFDFSKANLYRKYGPDWANIVRELQHRRLRSWGFNTIGNWSDTQTMLMRKTPYVVAIHFHRMNFGHHHDVFDGEFQSELRRRMEREIGTTANDPWNIGYFVDNELDWGIDPNYRALGWRAAQAPPDQPAKIQFVNDLKAKYTTIEALNQAWQKQFASWDALLANREPISSADVPAIREDYEAFGTRFAETYFRICREEVKRVAPKNLYLGVRFHGHKDPTQLALAAKYCDVISYNIYDRTPTGRANQYLGKVDHPILIGEWGFGSDYVQTPFRGRPEEDKTWTPQQRVDHLRNYMAAAMRHPLIIGAHFFQMRDQALTGRGDGEAVLRGFLNVADTPNYLLVEANRKVAAELYKSRTESP
ncbi:beta-galactosidase [Fontivita pretiosa]|uniref:beta-galactosidase n=1 Tax=Fontivita pretiosa TaxID=2989684 RepID=UPI003D186B01